ncbi:exodeoxyribonuclease VII large subunit [Actinosynnema pretiosum subsp. pretiosum]|uniref:Exodeoxyribonuclease 7 large subunit n=2 Tax=Actinosynnema TaxID=40566 RepID=C6WKT5_ACTMD|nr:exodeoxyribonuclease VII large subunit [Actinosynnema mirum]ACU34690.1 exodeoxyribonuclease VII, large subunit [Actinosynnema mirum DSM 43827]QUF07548.1 exodeoxyribonuclease VII large subunit [Actinosynnema pretiosum subsp. pretiosum]
MTEQKAQPPRSSPEEPWPVRTVAYKIADWIGRLGDVWVEGQVTQLSARPGTKVAFLTLRDPSADLSMSLTAPVGLVREGQLTEGSRVVVHGKPNYYAARGTISLRVDEIRAVGIGELLARIERLRKLLAAEGLFDARRKRRPPFLPNKIGLVTGRASAAERDVLTNAQARWPAARFRVINVAVQGPSAVPEVVRALGELDADPEVDVIVLARGGGSVEDLLPFSDEALCRAVSDCRTPLLSAIGHEPDTPLVDHVADVRCSTPTDAGKRVVPDVAEETERLRQARDRARRALRGWVDRERKLLDALRTRPALADPHGPLERRSEEVQRLRDRALRAVRNRVDAENAGLAATSARLTTLGPAATLARGYAVVQLVSSEGTEGVLRSAADAPAGTRLRVRVADGAVHAVVEGGGGGGAQSGS